MGRDENLQDYGHFFGVIKKSMRAHQLRAMRAVRAVNRELVGLYGEIGKAIQKKQEQLGWGKAVVENLARDLQAAFPGRSGFYARNLWNMKNLYAIYSISPKLQPLVAELGWCANESPYRFHLADQASLPPSFSSKGVGIYLNIPLY